MVQRTVMEASRTYDWVLKPPDAEIVKRFVDEVLIPNAEKVRSIASRGDIPIVLFEPMADLVQIFGRGSSGPVVPMTSAQRRELSKLPDTRSWIQKQAPKGVTKVLGVIHLGTFLFNWVDGHELYIEPGSLDHEWRS